MNWRLKALAFKILELPGGEAVHHLLQRRVTRTWPRPRHVIEGLVRKAERVVEDCVRSGIGLPDSVMEVGAGRDLTVPLALRRLGVRRVIASDISRLARIDLINHAASVVWGETIHFRDWNDVSRFGIDYRAPHFPREYDAKVSCTCSNEVLEHVPVTDLKELLAAIHGVTTGITTHSIDYSDHYANADPSISRLNFLRFTDAEWRPFNSRFQYVNRLRHCDYVRMFREAGFRVTETRVSRGEVSKELALAIAPQFKAYGDEDLFSEGAFIVAKPC